MRYAILGGLVLLALLALSTTQDWSAQTSTRVLAIDLPAQAEPVELRPRAQQRGPRTRSVDVKPKPTTRAQPSRTEPRKPPRTARAPARAPASSPSRGAAPVQSRPPVPIQSRDDDARSDDGAGARPAPAPAPAPAAPTPQEDNDDGDGAGGGDTGDTDD